MSEHTTIRVAVETMRFNMIQMISERMMSESIRRAVEAEVTVEKIEAELKLAIDRELKSVCKSIAEESLRRSETFFGFIGEQAKKSIDKQVEQWREMERENMESEKR